MRAGRLGALALALVLGGCDSAPGAPSDAGSGRAEGEVLGGTISDDMIALEQLRSQAPLAPREGPSAAEVDAAQPQVAGELAPADSPTQSSPSAAAGPAVNED